MQRTTPSWMPYLVCAVVLAGLAGCHMVAGLDDLEPIAGHEGAFSVTMSWGDPIELAPDTDGGAVERGEVAITYLSRFLHDPADEFAPATEALDALLR